MCIPVYVLSFVVMGVCLKIIINWCSDVFKIISDAKKIYNSESFACA